MKLIKGAFLTLFLILMVGCNWGHKTSDPQKESMEETSHEIDSSKIMYNKSPHSDKTGVGPIKEKVELGLQIDTIMAAKGEALFNNKCSTCHEIHDTNVGPALGGVLEKRSPQWVMNMILTPREMVEHDPQARALKRVYEVQMVDMELSREEARQIVEYLREY